VHCERPELVAEIEYLTWTDDNLLRQVVYEACARTSRQWKCGPVLHGQLARSLVEPGSAE
jgi:hypothetical protein